MLNQHNVLLTKTKNSTIQGETERKTHPPLFEMTHSFHPIFHPPGNSRAAPTEPERPQRGRDAKNNSFSHEYYVTLYIFLHKKLSVKYQKTIQCSKCSQCKRSCGRKLADVKMSSIDFPLTGHHRVCGKIFYVYGLNVNKIVIFIKNLSALKFE